MTGVGTPLGGNLSHNSSFCYGAEPVVGMGWLHATRAAREQQSLVECLKPLVACDVEFKISKITPSQVPQLLKLIRELARFEKLEHEVNATVASLRKSLFGRRPAAGALLAHSGDKVIGYAVYFSTFSSFDGRPGLWLDDLYVRPKFRKQGVGRRLIEAVAGIAAKRNCGRFEWIALDWNRNALDFYRQLGAKALDEWVLIRLDSRGLRRLAGRNSKSTSARGVRSPR